MNKLVIIVGGICLLILLPPIKGIYDDLWTTYAGLSPNSFVTAFFALLPYIALGVIVFGTIWKLFRREDSGEL